jgi:hypothetical protein
MGRKLLTNEQAFVGLITNVLETNEINQNLN